MDSKDERQFWKEVRWVKHIKPGMLTWCWVYGKGKGYGMVTVNGKPFTLAHEYSWTLKGGPKPSPGFALHHLCKVKRCVNPEHLVMATDSGHKRQLHKLDFHPRFPCGCELDEVNPQVNAAGQRLCHKHQPIPESCKTPEQEEHLAKVGKLANVYGANALDKLGPFPASSVRHWVITSAPIPTKYFAKIDELFNQLK
jgi:hypothetical protein